MTQEKRLEIAKRAATAENIDVSDFESDGTPVAEVVLDGPLSSCLNTEAITCVLERLKIGETRYSNLIRCITKGDEWPRDPIFDTIQELSDAIVYLAQKHGDEKNLHSVVNIIIRKIIQDLDKNISRLIDIHLIETRSQNESGSGSSN